MSNNKDVDKLKSLGKELTSLHIDQRDAALLSNAQLKERERDIARVSGLINTINAQLPKNQLYLYQPYQKQMDFHHCLARERCFMAPNQTGKTIAGGAEMAYHITGDYPKWYKGKRFEEPTKAWASGVTGTSTRDNPQRILLGMPDKVGTGYIPESKILNAQKATHGPPGLYDFVQMVWNSVHSPTQGTAYLFFKSYEQGREKWQGESIHVVWFDEEPPLKIYTEGLTRTNARKGLVYLTFTPLLGMSQVVRRFMKQGTDNRKLMHMDITDVGHYTKQEIKDIIDSYPEHEVEARVHGRPVLGSGAVFPVLEDGIKYDAFEMPQHWPRIAGIDFGWDHPTAVVWLAWDKDTDIVYLYDCYSEKKRIISHHASCIKAKGSWIPLAWPHDGMETDPRSGETLIELYKAEGVNSLDGHSKYPDTRGNSLEASVADLHNRMETGRFKVARHLSAWWDEFRMYHREEGKIVPKDDDAISATRYALMRLTDARIPPDYIGHQSRYKDRYSASHGRRSFMSG